MARAKEVDAVPVTWVAGKPASIVRYHPLHALDGIVGFPSYCNELCIRLVA